MHTALYTASRGDFGATADRYNRQIAQNRSAGIRGMRIQFRGTHRNRLQSLRALTIHEKQVIVTFSSETTVQPRCIGATIHHMLKYSRALQQYIKYIKIHQEFLM